jgi:hypothetical protein
VLDVVPVRRGGRVAVRRNAEGRCGLTASLALPLAAAVMRAERDNARGNAALAPRVEGESPGLSI